MANSPVLVLWDSDEIVDLRGDVVVLWKSFGDKVFPNMYSLPRLVEDNASALKSRYLNWIDDLGQLGYGGAHLRDLMEIRPGLSYWWMTRISEKSYARSPYIYEVLLLFAFEDLCKSINPGRLLVRTSNETLRRAVRDWCVLSGVTFESTSGGYSNPKWQEFLRTLGVISTFLVSILRIFFYYFRSIPVSKNLAELGIKSGGVTIVDYLAHLSGDSDTAGRFASNYWTTLVDTLRSSDLTVTWFHHYVKHARIRSRIDAERVITRFNRSCGDQESHFCIEGAVSLRVVCGLAFDYFKLVRLFWRLREIKKYFRPEDSSFDLWAFYRDDWVDSLLGTAAVWNCYNLNIFKKLLENIPPQKIGLYLQENQSWEMALTYHWKRMGHGKLIGVPHATVRFWDLRYSHSPSEFNFPVRLQQPRPDFVAVNSSIARKAYLQGGYPSTELYDVEALRYLYLRKVAQAVRHDGQVDPHGRIRVLILGDISPSVDDMVFRFVTDASSLLVRKVTFSFRAHPACPVRRDTLLKAEVVPYESSLLELIRGCDIVLTGASTSAAVDAYSGGAFVVQILSPKMLNLCPLRGLPGVTYITEPIVLREFLENFVCRNSGEWSTYFNLDERIPRWRRIFGLQEL